MKKIMFNDQYGLTKAVLEGKKTMTRRMVAVPKKLQKATNLQIRMSKDKACAYCVDCVLPYSNQTATRVKMPYAVGEEVAIAQPYKNDDVLTYNAYNEDGTAREDGFQRHKEMLGSNGYRNKMFVKAEYMPHRIRITGIKVERLQDVREEDTMREGVFKYDKPPLHHEADMFAPWAPYVRPYKWDSDNLIYRCTARYAFAYLIDKISGGGTWNRNPWVFAYEFELLK